MPILNFNNAWMLYNIFLALLAIGFGYFFLISKSTIFKFVFGILWVLFLPNTIYIFTDLEHLIDQWPLLPNFLRVPLILQYIILEIVGIFTFIVALYPFEKIVLKWKPFKKDKIFVIIFFNFLIAFGMVLGRVERINSWEVFTNPLQVLSSAYHVLFSYELFGLMILFGILCNCFYFLFRDRVLYSLGKLSHVLD